jgi:hypothetical protein
MLQYLIVDLQEGELERPKLSNATNQRIFDRLFARFDSMAQENRSMKRRLDDLEKAAASTDGPIQTANKVHNNSHAQYHLTCDPQVIIRQNVRASIRDKNELSDYHNALEFVKHVNGGRSCRLGLETDEAIKEYAEKNADLVSKHHDHRDNRY